MSAGSIEFAIEEVGVPVGRIAFLHIYPMSFIEFLWALKEMSLPAAILKQEPTNPFSDSVHKKHCAYLANILLSVVCLKRLIFGGKLKVIYVEIHHDLLSSYQQDFEKYACEPQIKYVEHLFQQASHQLGERFRFSKLTGHFRARELMPALELLKKANIITTII
ncbi:ATP-binding protein [Coxiella endosymbiont of Ornithodoros maritimus]|uniref:hypothetical protein n=1 Tax=Coxiella endosymbiont of Ornithodoros maritimus TaxID=1656172 RepID=UPI002264B82E|nr:hypothetical protein [Coxiella endosymbiont of Ornithodoros maritimus]